MRGQPAVGISGSNDFVAMMVEVCYQRLLHLEWGYRANMLFFSVNSVLLDYWIVTIFEIVGKPQEHRRPVPTQVYPQSF